MKTVFNIVLVLCAAALIYICYNSIMGPINFENAKKDREKAVIARLIDIRKAQQEYRMLHHGMYAPKLDTIYPKGFNPDSMKFIPHGNGAQFEMNVRNDTAKSGAPVYLFEVKAPYDTYLSGLDKQEIINLKDLDSKLGKYSGLMVGSIDTPNNGAGNWE